MTEPLFSYPELADALDICDLLGLHILDVGAPASAVERPARVVWGAEAYEAIHAKGAALLDAVNRSHPLLDGNTRLSILLVMLLYRLNGFDLVIDAVEGDAFIRRVAGAPHLELDEIASCLGERTGPL
jgi:death-on-curing protein